MSADASGEGAITRRRPIRVLLASRDRRFLEVARFLLVREGAIVSTLRPEEPLLDRVESEPVDVLVLDGADSLGETAGTLAELDLRQPGLPVILLADRAGPSLTRLHVNVWPKWDRLEELVAAAESLCESSEAVRA